MKLGKGSASETIEIFLDLFVLIDGRWCPNGQDPSAPPQKLGIAHPETQNEMWVTVHWGSYINHRRMNLAYDVLFT